jgi:poly(hydroxyalkanoate) depolymerase family esterase
MNPIDWRELYAANRAAIERAGVGTGAAAAARALAAPAALLGSAQPAAAMPLTDLPGVLAAALPGAIIGAPTALPATLPGVPQPASTPPRRRVRPARRGGALVHLPAGVDRATAVPLVCMLHGCTQDPQSFAAATRMNETADRHGFAVVYPRQEPDANPQRCWNWFLPEHQERGGGEAGAIATATRGIVAGGTEQAIDARRVFVAGLSSGGAMAAILAFTDPDLFAAVAVHSGLAYRSAASMPAAFTAMARGGEDPTLLGPAAHAAMGDRARPVPGMVIHGDADPTVACVNGDQLLRQLMHANRLAAPDGPGHHPDRPSERSRGSVDGGHAYTRSRWSHADGTVVHERLIVHGMGHAWSGGLAGGSFTDPQGPDATEAIWRFFSAAVPRDRAT